MNESEVFLAVFPEAALSDFSAALALNTRAHCTAYVITPHNTSVAWYLSSDSTAVHYELQSNFSVLIET